MPRALRLDFPDAVHHVTGRGVNRCEIFVDDGDRHVFLRLLAEVSERNDWRPLCHCLMDNHYHLVVRTPQAGLAVGMRRLNGRYAQEFNRRHGRSGHLFQDRYWSELIWSDRHLLALAAYIEMNPVAAGLCATPSQWPWSERASELDELLADYQR